MSGFKQETSGEYSNFIIYSRRLILLGDYIRRKKISGINTSEETRNAHIVFVRKLQGKRQLTSEIWA
jgi:hypothetical protein